MKERDRHFKQSIQSVIILFDYNIYDRICEVHLFLINTLAFSNGIYLTIVEGNVLCSL